MTDTPTEPEYRTAHRAGPEETRLVDPAEGGDDGLMAIRLPVASTGDVRNEGDSPLSTGELRGMAEQINARNIGVFPDHGFNSDTAGDRYSQLEKMGWWSDAEVEAGAAADGEDLLVATANMPDPETLSASTGGYRQALAVYKEQAKRGVPMDASIGWREDETMPGGNDLMEVSIVGIGADPRTNIGPDGQAQALARAAVRAGADPDDLVAEVKAAVEGAEDTENQDMTETDESGDQQDADTTDEQDADDGETRQFSEEELAAVAGAAAANARAHADDIADDTTDDLRDNDDVQFTDEELAQIGGAVAGQVEAHAGPLGQDAADALENGDTETQADDDYDDEDDEEDEEDDDEDRETDADETQGSDDVADLRAELRELREEHEQLQADIRNGDVDLERPDPEDSDDDRDADADADTDGQERDAEDADGTDEQPDDDGTATVTGGFSDYQ